jgi:catechol 2,3-dioxygenase-like lactoylglutathione lyase family enzyme
VPTELAHVGYLAADLDAAVERAERVFALPCARTLELPQFDLRAVFLGSGSGSVEIFTFTDPELLGARLAGRDLLLDHAAFTVPDIRERIAVLAGEGVRFAGPDHRRSVSEPFELGGALHIWSVPGPQSWALQLIQPLP